MIDCFGSCLIDYVVDNLFVGVCLSYFGFNSVVCVLRFSFGLLLLGSLFWCTWLTGCVLCIVCFLCFCLPVGLLCCGVVLLLFVDYGEICVYLVCVVLICVRLLWMSCWSDCVFMFFVCGLFWISCFGVPISVRLLLSAV